MMKKGMADKMGRALKKKGAAGRAMMGGMGAPKMMRSGGKACYARGGGIESKGKTRGKFV